MTPDIVKKQLCYWIRVAPADRAAVDNACISQQAGIGLVTCVHAAASGIYVFQLGVVGALNFSVPINRRVITYTLDAAIAEVGSNIQYDSSNAGAPADNIVRILTSTGAGPAVSADRAFSLAIYRVESQIGTAAAPLG